MKETVIPTRAVNLRKEPYDVYIGRGSKWGNPYSHLALEGTKAQFAVATRKDAIKAYEEWLVEHLELVEEIPKLKGLRLGCYCKPAACHGDVLARLADES